TSFGGLLTDSEGFGSGRSFTVSRLRTPGASVVQSAIAAFPVSTFVSSAERVSAAQDNQRSAKVSRLFDREASGLDNLIFIGANFPQFDRDAANQTAWVGF